jgi:hypothetical protein
MAISIIPNQALGFLPDRDCNCGGAYCQPIQTDDEYMLQGIISASTGNNKVFNADFGSATGWTLAAGWSISGGKLVGTNVTSGNKAETDISVYSLELIAGRTYRIDTSVNVTSAGGAGINQGWYIVINGEFLALPGTTLGQGYNADLTHSWYYTPASISSQTIYFSTNENTIDLEVEYLNIYDMSTVGVQVIDGNDAVIEDYPDAAFIDYYPNNSFTGLTNSVLMEATLDFSTLVDVGCYKLSLYDSFLTEVNQIRNGDFDIGLTWWTVGVNWSWDATGKAHYQPDFITAGQLSQSIILIGGVQYVLSFFITSLGVGNQMRVFIDTGSGSVLWGTFTGNGPKEGFIDLTAFTGQVAITIYFAGGDPENEYMLDQVSVLAFTADSANVSNCFNLRETHDCTLLIEAFNNDNAFGFDYETGTFTQSLRVKAKMDVISYPEEKEEYLFSDNSRAILFARSEKEYDVKLGDAPEYIHDCLARLRLHDNFEINSEQYISSSDYDLRGRKTSRLKQAVFNVKDRVGLASNYSC